MIAYGTKIRSRPPLPVDLAGDNASRLEVLLVEGPPKDLKEKLSLGYPFLQAQQRRIFLYSDSPPGKRTEGQPWCYEIENVLRFYWISGEMTIYYHLETQGNETLLCYWFLHIFLPYFLCAEGKFQFFHGAAIERNGQAELFMAPSMGGKSTLTEYLLGQGLPLISDDKIAVFLDGNRFMAVPSHPYHRPYRKFEDLGIRAPLFSAGFRPISHIYILSPRDATAEAAIVPLTGHQKFTTLFPHFFHFSTPLRPERFAFLSSFAHNIPVSNLLIPWNLTRLDDVSKLLEHQPSP